MSLKVDGILGVEEMLMVMETTTRKRSVKGLIKAGKRLQKLAIKMAPVDEGNLEKAIKMIPEGEGRERDDLGRFVRTEVEVYVDMDMPVPQRPGKTVGDYAYEIHEHLTPMGQKNLGPKSNMKQMGSNVIVGGGFMTRAADVIEQGLEADIVEALSEPF